MEQVDGHLSKTNKEIEYTAPKRCNNDDNNY